MSVQAEALADFIATERDKYPRRADDMDSEELAQKIIEWQASRKPEAVPATPVSDPDREVLRWALRNVLTGASVQGDSERGADAVIAAGFSRSQPVQVEVTDEMVARAEREYQWSGNIRKVLTAALGGGDHAE